MPVQRLPGLQVCHSELQVPGVSVLEVLEGVGGDDDPADPVQIPLIRQLSVMVSNTEDWLLDPVLWSNQ